MTEKRKEFLEQLSQTNNETDENKVFAAMNTSGRTREIYAEAERNNRETKEFIKNLKVTDDMDHSQVVYAAMSLSGSARAKLAKAQKLVDDSKESLR